MFSRLLRKFFNVYSVYDNNSKKFFSIKMGWIDSDKAEFSSNFVLIAISLPFILWMINTLSFGKYKLRVRKLWMPVWRINASIKQEHIENYYEKENNG